MADWIYPVDENSVRWGLGQGVIEYFRSEERANWGLSTGFRQIQPGDRLWVYATAPLSRVVAVGLVITLGEVVVGSYVEHRVEIEWDRGTNRRLVTSAPAALLDSPPQNVRRVKDLELSRLSKWVEVEGSTAPVLPPTRLKVLQEVTRRRGQGPFRDALLVAYGSRCAISDCVTPAALEAAHLRPYDGPSTSVVTNGLLLRGDLHTLFDAGLLWVDTRYKVRLSDAVTDDGYSAFEGTSIRVPKDKAQRPSMAALRSRMPNRSTS